MDIERKYRDRILIDCIDIASYIIKVRISSANDFLDFISSFVKEMDIYSEESLAIIEVIVTSNHGRIWTRKGWYINAYFNMVNEILRDFEKGYNIRGVKK